METRFKYLYLLFFLFYFLIIIMSSQQTRSDVEELKRGVPGEHLFDHVDFETWLTAKAPSREESIKKAKIYKPSPSKRKLSTGNTAGVVFNKVIDGDEDLLNINGGKVFKERDNSKFHNYPGHILLSDTSSDDLDNNNNNNNNQLEKGEKDQDIMEIDHNVINDDILDDSFDEDIPTIIKDEMETFIESFPTLDSKYKLINKIGEGTFSTVYKAKSLINLNSKQLKSKYVALKRIYVTSSPNRIFNELSLLNTLIGNPNVAPLLDALRYEDQVIAVLPYYDHADFRDFYRDLPLAGIKFYMYELFKGIQFVHGKGIIHRDIKPTNFLYNPFTRHGVLVDFGLAEKEIGPDPQSNCCSCVYSNSLNNKINSTNGFPLNAYLKDDQRPGRRANRAGTRGFRAPEVLLKCNNQSTKLDIWSAGVMLLTLLGRRFPFFNSTDDVEALMEITNIFGLNEMKKCAKLHGLGFESTAPKIDGHSIGELLLFCVSTDAKEGDTFAPDSPAWEILHALDKKGEPINTQLGKEYKEGIELLESCLKLDFNERVTATNALKMDFFKEVR